MIYSLNTNLFKSLHGLVHLMKVMHIWYPTGFKKIMLIKVHKREQISLKLDLVHDLLVGKVLLDK